MNGSMGAMCPARSTMPGFPKYPSGTNRSRAKAPGRIKALRLELKKLEGGRMDVDIFLETVRRYTDAPAQIAMQIWGIVPLARAGSKVFFQVRQLNF